MGPRRPLRRRCSHLAAIAFVVLGVCKHVGRRSLGGVPLTAKLAHGTSRNFSPTQVVSRGFGFGPFVDLRRENLRDRTVSHTKGCRLGAVPLIASPGGSGVIFFCP